MNSQTQSEPSTGASGGDAGGADPAVRRRIVQVVIQYLFLAGVLFITSGRLDWVWAWAYLGAALAILIINVQIVPRELIAERGRLHPDAKQWDKVLTGITMVPVLAMLLLVGLDHRFGWSPVMAVGPQIGGVVLFAAGQGLFSWAMASNVYFSGLVSIQMDRDHTVASSGPYRYVRHPGYSGFILFTLATPLALGSLWAWIPASITSLLLVVRTVMEDGTLQEELPGYQTYAQRVRYRLIPGLW